MVKENRKFYLYLLFTHRILVTHLLTVHLISAHVNKSLDTSHLGRLQQNVCAHDVVLSELERVSE